MSKTGRGADQYMMRFPDGMRDTLHDLAKQNGRSINSEIIVALEKHLASNGIEIPNSNPTGFNPRLDTFVAAALSGLLAKMAEGDAIDVVCGEARMIGSYMLESMEAIELGEQE